MHKIILFIISLILFSELYSQNWKRQRMEIGGHVGVTSFLGDLGGSSAEGGNYGPKDLDFAATGFAIGGALRYYLRSNMAAKANLSFAQVSGDDANSANETRRRRGLNFRTQIVELSVQYEYYFLSERTKGMYRLRGAKGLRKLKLDGYLFAGLGAFYYNPQGYANGEWHNLRNIGTEGQTSGAGSKYSVVAGTMLGGLGFKKKINRKISIGLEMGVRFTTSDYVDDVSGKYYEIDKIKAANPDDPVLAAKLANPNQTDPNQPSKNNWPSVTYNQDGSISEYQQRGDPDNNDTYMFTTLTFTYKIVKKRRSMPKF